MSRGKIPTDAGTVQDLPIALEDGEELRHDLSPKWYGRFTIKRLVWWIVATVCTAGLALLYFWYPALQIWRKSRKIQYIVTSERVVVRDRGGLMGSKRSEEYPLRDVSDVETSATWLEQRAGVGTVSFREHDGAQSEIELVSIPEAERVASTIGARQRRESRRSRHR